MKRILTQFFVLLLGASLLAGCSSNKLVLKPLSLKKFEKTAKIEVLWKRGVGKGQDARYTQLVPVIAGDSIVTTDIKGTIIAINRSDGKKLWEVKLGERVSAGMGVSANGKMIFVGTYDANIIALNVEDGSEVWRQTVSSEVLSAPRSNAAIVVVQTLDDKLFALDLATGKQLWEYEASSPPLTVRGTATPVITRDAVYAGFANGKVYALEAEDGLLEWDQRVAIPQGRGDFERMVDVDSSPMLVNEILFCASFQGQIVAFSRSTGRPLWSKPVSTSYNLAAGQGKVYLSDGDSSVKAYNIGNGEILWENNQLLRRDVYAPQAVGSYLAVADQEGGVLHILDQSDGSFAARKKIDGDGVRSPMITDGEVLYVLSDSGNLLALKIEALN